MTWHARAGGVWRDITDPSVRVGGLWRPVLEAWVRVSGVWQRFYLRVTVAISNETVVDIGANNPASAGYQLTGAGAVNLIVNGSPTGAGNWITPQTGMSGYEVEVTATGSGGTLTGTTGSGVWQNLGTTRTWTLSSSVSGLFCNRSLSVSIRDATTLTVLTTATISLQVEAS